MVANAFENMHYRVTNVTMDQEYWKEDVDLIIHDADTDWKIEVKADWNIWKTHNICLEMYNYKTNSNGWFKTTQSSHLVFVDMHNRFGYIFKTEELQKYVYASAHTGAYCEKMMRGFECALIPLASVSALYQVINL